MNYIAVNIGRTALQDKESDLDLAGCKGLGKSYRELRLNENKNNNAYYRSIDWYCTCYNRIWTY